MSRNASNRGVMEEKIKEIMVKYNIDYNKASAIYKAAEDLSFWTVLEFDEAVYRIYELMQSFKP